MAEVAAAASLIGIITFGLQLSKTLHKYGSMVHAAKEQTGFVATHITLYVRVLSLLQTRLEDEVPIHSSTSVKLVSELCKASSHVLLKIDKKLPKSSSGELSFTQKMKWPLRTDEVRLLVGELEYLKSTLHLLVTILYAGKRVQQVWSVTTLGQMESPALTIVFSNGTSAQQLKPKSSMSRVPNEVLKREERKTQNALLQRFDAAEKLALLRSSKPGRGEQQASADILDWLDSLEQHFSKALPDALVAANSDEDWRSTVSEKSESIFQDLLHDWTTISPQKPTRRHQSKPKKKGNDVDARSHPLVRSSSQTVNPKIPKLTPRKRKVSSQAEDDDSEPQPIEAEPLFSTHVTPLRSPSNFMAIPKSQDTNMCSSTATTLAAVSRNEKLDKKSTKPKVSKVAAPAPSVSLIRGMMYMLS